MEKVYKNMIKKIPRDLRINKLPMSESNKYIFRVRDMEDDDYFLYHGKIGSKIKNGILDFHQLNLTATGYFVSDIFKYLQFKSGGNLMGKVFLIDVNEVYIVAKVSNIEIPNTRSCCCIYNNSNFSCCCGIFSKQICSFYIKRYLLRDSDEDYEIFNKKGINMILERDEVKNYVQEFSKPYTLISQGNEKISKKYIYGDYKNAIIYSADVEKHEKLEKYTRYSGTIGYILKYICSFDFDHHSGSVVSGKKLTSKLTKTQLIADELKLRKKDKFEWILSRTAITKGVYLCYLHKLIDNEVLLDTEKAEKNKNIRLNRLISSFRKKLENESKVLIQGNVYAYISIVPGSYYFPRGINEEIDEIVIEQLEIIAEAYNNLDNCQILQPVEEGQVYNLRKELNEYIFSISSFCNLLRERCLCIILIVRKRREKIIRRENLLRKKIDCSNLRSNIIKRKERIMEEFENNTFFLGEIIKCRMNNFIEFLDNKLNETINKIRTGDPFKIKREMGLELYEKSSEMVSFVDYTKENFLRKMTKTLIDFIDCSRDSVSDDNEFTSVLLNRYDFNSYIMKKMVCETSNFSAKKIRESKNKLNQMILREDGANNIF